MAENKEEKKLVPPYLSYKTFLNFIERLKVGIPSRIDRSVMGNFSGAAQAQLFTTLRYLHLIKPDDTPEEKLTQLVNSEGANRQKMLKDIITAAYPFLFNDAVDLKRTTLGHLQDLFEKANASGGTTRKCMAFFMTAAKDAGIELSPHLKIKGVGRITGKARKTRQDKGEENGGSLQNEGRLQSQTSTLTWQQILASKFPAFDPIWTAEVQAKWFEGFNKLMEQFKKPEDAE